MVLRQTWRLQRRPRRAGAHRSVNSPYLPRRVRPLSLVKLVGHRSCRRFPVHHKCPLNRTSLLLRARSRLSILRKRHRLVHSSLLPHATCLLCGNLHLNIPQTLRLRVRDFLVFSLSRETFLQRGVVRSSHRHQYDHRRAIQLRQRVTASLRRRLCANPFFLHLIPNE